MNGQSVHVPVMPREVLHYLQLSPGLIVVDGTVGAGGHSSQVVQRIQPDGILIGIDRDPMMLSHAQEKLCQTPAELVQGTYADARAILDEREIPGADRILLDLGLSSDQLADRERGFGFDAGGPLDMRFDQSLGMPAKDILNSQSAKELEEIFSEYGEEPGAGRIAAEIVRTRATTLLETTSDLEECIFQAIGSSKARSKGRHPGTRVFQALRIVVNDELNHVHRMMTEVLPTVMNPDGIAVVITFHSLEDRIVKSAFKGHQGWHVLTKKAVEATPAEISLNPRSRSAKLRAAQWRPL